MMEVWGCEERLVSGIEVGYFVVVSKVAGVVRSLLSLVSFCWRGAWILDIHVDCQSFAFYFRGLILVCDSRARTGMKR